MAAAKNLTPAQRTMRARMAAHASWANTPSPRERTSKARNAFLSRFERQVDPEGVLPEKERQRRAESARKAYFTELAYRRSRTAQSARRAA